MGSRSSPSDLGEPAASPLSQTRDAKKRPAGIAGGPLLSDWWTRSAGVAGWHLRHEDRVDDRLVAALGCERDVEHPVRNLDRERPIDRDVATAAGGHDIEVRQDARSLETDAEDPGPCLRQLELRERQVDLVGAVGNGEPV